MNALHTGPLRVDLWAHRVRRHLPAGLAPWLTGTGSLTARLRARSQHFAVQVISQRLALPVQDEARLFGLRHHRPALVREVLLCTDGMPVVFAHSVVLPRDVRGVWHLVAGLGTRPLGAILFEVPTVRRGPLAARRLPAADPRVRRAAQSAGLPAAVPLWARRSMFFKQGRPLLVTEVFLPAIEKLPR